MVFFITVFSLIRWIKQRDGVIVNAVTASGGTDANGKEILESTFTYWYNAENKLLVSDRHLLSLKDFNASQHLRKYLEMGITSLKIEGRLKDLCFVKNVTAYYRKLLDDILLQKQSWQEASSGQCVFSFEPDVERTFNRGFTDYFLRDRQPMASLTTQKSIGKRIGKVLKADRNALVCKTELPVTAGDGLCFFGISGALQGFSVNRVIGNKVYPNNMPDEIVPGTELYRNNDFAFEKWCNDLRDRRL